MSRPTTPSPHTPLPPAVSSNIPPFSPPSPSVSGSLAPSPRHPIDADTVNTTQLSLDEDGDLVFVFDTPHQQYGLVLPLHDVLDLTWKETQAIVDALRISAPGKVLTPTSFAHSLKLMEHKYGSSKGPVKQEDGRICGAFYPVRGTIATNSTNDPNMIVSAMLRMDIRDRRIVILAHTLKESVYSIRLGLRGQQGTLNYKECCAFIDVLTVLEPGDIVNENAFFKFSRFMERRYGNAKLSTIQENGLHIYNIDSHPFPKKKKVHLQPNPTVDKTPTVNATGTPRTSNDLITPVSTPEHSNSTPTHINVAPSTNPECPYPGFSYRKLIADSGQAKVFEGLREGDEKRVAIKVFHLDEDSTEAYKTELRLLLKMGAHENVVSVVDFFEYPQPALVTEFINGMELGDYIQRHGHLSQREGVHLSKGIAKGLFHLHKHGIVHRDLKSGNVLVTENSKRKGQLTPIIIDLGLSSVFPIADIQNSLSPKNMITKEVKGTPLWMAPEMILRREWSEKTDIYAFGMILWELFSGSPPFVTELPSSITQMELLVQIANGKRPNIESIGSVVDRRIQSLITECWNSTPRNRPSARRVLGFLAGDDPKEIFERHDINCNGELEYHEFVLFLQVYAPKVFSPKQTAALFETIDEDKSGEISYTEFERFWRQVEIAGIESVISRQNIPQVVSVPDVGPGLLQQRSCSNTTLPCRDGSGGSSQSEERLHRQRQDTARGGSHSEPLANLLKKL